MGINFKSPSSFGFICHQIMHGILHVCLVPKFPGIRDSVPYPKSIAHATDNKFGADLFPLTEPEPIVKTPFGEY